MHQYILRINYKTADGRYELTDFEIDTDLINRMEYNQKTTYSFVATPKDTIVENYFNLIYYKKNNVWEMKIVELKPNPDNLIKLQSGLTTEFEGQMRMVYETVPTIMSQPCSQVTITIENCQGCVGTCDECSRCVSSRTYSFCNQGIEFISAPPSAPSGFSGGGGGGGGPNADPNEIVIDPNLANLDFNKIILFLNNLRTTDLVAFNYLNSHTEIKNQVFRYLGQNDFSEESRIFADWTLNYLSLNLTVTFQQCQNWFMGASEGIDGEYDAAYWENPSLTFPPQNLPAFLNFKTACLSKYDNAGTVCNTIGGDVLTMYNAVIAQNKKLNTCAIRVSRALNYSGVVIPSLPDNPDGTKNSITGADGKNYIINAKALNVWMRKTFGTNPSNYKHYTASLGGVKGENFPNLLANVNGIYSMIALPNIQNSWGTGHADLLENGSCLLSCHFYDENNYFVPVSYIDLWILN